MTMNLVVRVQLDHVLHLPAPAVHVLVKLVRPAFERGETCLPNYAPRLLCSGLAQVTQRWLGAFKPTKGGCR
jgi:hypothetical protein